VMLPRPAIHNWNGRRRTQCVSVADVELLKCLGDRVLHRRNWLGVQAASQKTDGEFIAQFPECACRNGPNVAARVVQERCDSRDIFIESAPSLAKRLDACAQEQEALSIPIGNNHVEGIYDRQTPRRARAIVSAVKRQRPNRPDPNTRIRRKIERERAQSCNRVGKDLIELGACRRRFDLR